MLNSLLSFFGFNRLTWRGIPLKSFTSFELREMAKTDDDFARKILLSDVCEHLNAPDLYFLADTDEAFARKVIEMPSLAQKLDHTFLQRLSIKYEFVAQKVVNTPALSEQLTADGLVRLGIKYIYWANQILQNPNFHQKLGAKQLLELSLQYEFFARKISRNPEFSQKLSSYDLQQLQKKGAFSPQKNLFKTDFDSKWNHDEKPLGAPINLSFHWALKAQECDTERIHYLLENGVEIDERDENNRTPLHVVLEAAHFALAIQFIQLGASVEVADDFGNTPLHLAVIKKQITIVELILKSNPNIDAATNKKMTALLLASVINDYDIAALLLNHGASPALSDEYGNTPLHIALHHKQERLAQLFMKYKSPINTRNHMGYTPFVIALFSNLPNIAKELIARGVNITAPVNDGKTPLYFAILYCPTMVSALIQNRINLDIAVDDRMRAIQLAIKFGSEELALQILAAGVKLWTIDTEICPSPLFMALNTGTINLIQALIEAGADVNETYQGKRLLRITLERGETEKAMLLMNAPGFNEELHQECLTENLFRHFIDGHFTTLLIQKGANLNFQNAQGDTPLHVAIAKGHYAQAFNLIEQGANLTLKNLENETVLHVAIRQRHFGLVLHLIGKGADAKAKPDATPSILRFAIQLSTVEIVGCLLKAADFVNEILEEDSHVLRNALPNKEICCLLFSYLNEEGIPKATQEKYPELGKAYRNFQREIFLEKQRVRYFAYGVRQLHLPLEIVSLIHEKTRVNTLSEAFSPLYQARLTESLRQGFYRQPMPRKQNTPQRLSLI